MTFLLTAAFALALLATLAATPLAIYLAKAFHVFDQPDARKVHTTPIPRWGGIGLYLGFMGALACLYFFSDQFDWLIQFKGAFKSGSKIVAYLAIDKQLMGLITGGTLVFILGLFDDKRNVNSALKLAIQVIASYMAMDYGVRISGLTLPWAGYVQFPVIISQFLTIFWIVGFMNAVNLIDGLDGLASGLVAIASATFMIIAVLQWDSKVAIFSKEMKLAGTLSAGLFGASLGFLFYNFYPAKTFMGDSGALFLGFMLGTITLVGTLKTAAVIALIIPLIVVAVPIADIVLALIRRWRSKRGLMTPDREHFHHRLLSWGWTQREAVLLVYVFTLVLSVVSIVLTVFKARV